LGFPGLCGLLYKPAGSSGKSIQPAAPDQQLALAAIKPRAGNSLSKFHPARINRLQLSQNAAALLFDPETVDIR
jgi:hypothetical protein